MRFSSRVALLFAAVALFGGITRAEAQDSEAFFAQGRQLRQGGDCGAAIVAFRRALDIKPEGLGALRNVAECEELLGQFASARNDWWSLRRAVLQSNNPSYEGWDKEAEAAYAKLGRKVARLTVRVTGDALDRVRVSVDGKPLDPRLLGVELERDLGLHMVEAAYGGAAPLVEKRVLEAGSTETVTLLIPAPKATDTPLVAIAPIVPPPIVPPPILPQGSPGLRRAGIASVAVGGLGVVGVVVASVVRGSALSTVADACKVPDGSCNASQAVADAYDRGKTFSLLANVFGGVGIAGIGAGVAMIVVSGQSSAPAAAVKVDAGASPLPGGGGVWARVRF